MVGKKKAAKPPPRGKARPYHHGALREALIAAAEALIAERGVEGFTLREAARRAGVSPAAPAHHFGDAAGLLTEIALRAYQEFMARMAEARARAGSEPHAQLREQGIAYVRFALAFPGRFKLMSRKDLLRDEERVRTAERTLFAESVGVVRAYAGVGADRPIDRAAFAVMIGGWATVYGFAHLALEGRFEGGRLRYLGELVDMPPAGVEAFTNEILPQVLSALWPPRK
jgi:AcrR family transcriptional regulator